MGRRVAGRVVVAAFLFLLLLVFRDRVMMMLTPELLGARIDSFGIWAPMAYILIYVIAPLFLVPAMLLTVVAALIWSWPLALLYVLLGTNISANAGFWGGRRLRRSKLNHASKGRLLNLERAIARSGVASVFLVRMLPVAPFHVVNIAAGASLVKWRDFFIGTLLASLPGKLLTVYLVGSFDPRSGTWWVAIFALMVLVAVPYAIQKRQLASQAAGE